MAMMASDRHKVVVRRVLQGSALVGAVGLGWYVIGKKQVPSRKKIRGDDPSKASKESTTSDKQKKKNKKKRPASSLKKMMMMLMKVVGSEKIIVLIGLSIMKTLLSNRLAKLQGYLFRAAFLRRVPLFIRNIGENVLLCGVAAVLEASAKRWISKIELTWRDQLTDKLHEKYFNDMMYYKMSYVDRRIEQADQRICEDVPLLTAGMAELLQELITACVDATFYSYQLKKYSGTHGYTMSVLGYVIGVGACMTVAAPNFGGLYKKQQSLEGEYRNMHYRLMHNSESVAFYNGTEKEGSLIKDMYSQVVKHTKLVLGKQWRFLMVQDFLLKYLGATVAVALIIGPFFGGHLRPEATVMGRAQMLSNMRYHTSVIISLFGALGTLGSSSRKFLKLGAYSDRIQETFDVIRSISASGNMIQSNDGTDNDVPVLQGGRFEVSEDSIEFVNATVVTPANTTLVKDLSLRVPAGVNLLVTGPNGAGKSSLFRVLGGLWPLTSGVIKKPGGGSDETGLSHDIFYVPQKPYVSVGTLQEQLLYPLSPKDDTSVPEDELRSLLESVDLEYLLDRSGGSNEVVNWGEVLSLGEQQRLGMARLFYHKPSFAILDECTSGVTVEMEERFSNAVKDMGCTCITISHRPALMAFHDIVLNLDGEGGWSIHPGHRQAGNDVGKLMSSPKKQNKNKDAVERVRSKEVSEVLKGMTTKDEEADIELEDGNEGFSETIIARAPNEDSPIPDIWKIFHASEGKSLRSKWWNVLQVILGDPADSGLKVATVSAVVVLRTLLQDRIAKLNGRSVDLVLRQNLKGFILLIGQSVLQSAASAVLAPSLRHVADRLALTWRSRLTNAILRKYLKGYSPYCVSQLHNFKHVDQSITRDVERLSTDLAALVPTLVKPVTDIAWFSFQLWNLTGPRGAIILYSYALVGYGCLRMVTPDFAKILSDQYELEGAFRGAHERLRSHAESIAFFGGGHREGSEIDKGYRSLMRHLTNLINLKWKYGAADDFFAKQLPHSVTWILTLLYALDQQRDFGDSKFQGYLVLQMRYLASVVTQCFSAFGEILALPKRFAEISGSINRVSDTMSAIEKAYQFDMQSLEDREKKTSTMIKFDCVDIVTPQNVVMARKLSFSMPEGKSILITGPNGSGKTSIFRILAGLWPQSDGEIHSPPRGPPGGIFYVTQKPYTTIGTLRDQVVYPLTVRDVLETLKCNLNELDSQLDKLMRVVRLRYLIEREGGWDTEKKWGEVLSLGEQQRMGMARMFFHKPIFAVLDDCTNAMSVDVEESLYQYASETLGINLVTIAQRTALVKYHHMELKLTDGLGDWQLRTIKANQS